MPQLGKLHVVAEIEHVVEVATGYVVGPE